MEDKRFRALDSVDIPHRIVKKTIPRVAGKYVDTEYTFAEHGQAKVRGAHWSLRVQTFGERCGIRSREKSTRPRRRGRVGCCGRAGRVSDCEHVAFAEVVKASIQMRPGRGRAAHAMVGENARRPGFFKRVQLKLRILIGGRNPRVPDDCQTAAPMSHNPVQIPVLNTRGYETGFQDTLVGGWPWESDLAAEESSQSHQPIVFETGGKKDTLIQLVA